MKTRSFVSTGLPVLAGIVAAVGVVSLCAATGLLAQQPQPDRVREGDAPRREADRGRDMPRPRGPQDRPWQPGPPDGRPQRDFGSGPMPMRPGGGVALSATDTFVYVLRGNTLYQLSAANLKQLKKVRLEEDRPMGPPTEIRSGPGRGPIERDRGGDRSPRPRRPDADQPELRERQ